MGWHEGKVIGKN